MLALPEPGISVFGRLSVSHSAPPLGSPTCTTSQWIDPDPVDRHLVLLATLTGIGGGRSSDESLAQVFL